MSEFAVPACANCGHTVWPPHLACSHCGSGEWTEVPASSGTVLEVTDAPGSDGVSIRLGTVRLAVPYGRQESIRNSSTEGEAGPEVIARCEGCSAGDDVVLEMSDGALRALRK
jgi:Rubredoxin-like zinc ribbon domain (DUF35_N)